MPDAQSSIRIRRMTAGDLDAVTAIDQSSFPLPWPQDSFLFELERKPFARCWVAEVNDTVAGMLVGWLLDDEYQVATFAVAEAHRRMGIGRKLLEIALQAAEDEGAVRFTLEVRAGNLAAQSLYQAFGFRIVGTRPRGYSDGEDALQMLRSTE